MGKSNLWNLYKAALTAEGTMRKANKRLYEEAAKWTRNDLDGFFEDKLRKPTEAYFRDIANFPNCEDMVGKRTKGHTGITRWLKNTNNRKDYLLTHAKDSTKPKWQQPKEEIHGQRPPGIAPDMPDEVDDDRLTDMLANLYTRYGDRVDKLLPAARQKASKVKG